MLGICPCCDSAHFVDFPDCGAQQEARGDCAYDLMRCCARFAWRVALQYDWVHHPGCRRCGKSFHFILLFTLPRGYADYLLNSSISLVASGIVRGVEIGHDPDFVARNEDGPVGLAALLCPCVRHHQPCGIAFHGGSCALLRSSSRRVRRLSLSHTKCG